MWPFAVLALVVGLGPAAWAAGGQSTPGVTVTAQNLGAAGEPSDLRLTLTAHSEVSAVADPSCRPQDANIQCWGNLVLRIPEAGGLTLSGLQVHRIAVGDTACGGDEGGDSCGDMTAALKPDGSYPVNARVNGLSVMTNPGNSGLPVGTQVQVKIALTDNGDAQCRHGERAGERVRPGDGQAAHLADRCAPGHPAGADPLRHRLTAGREGGLEQRGRRRNSGGEEHETQ